MEIEEKLKRLGDPSGQQSSEYWNEWFEIVCRQEHRSFEWYCGVDEVVKVLKFHLKAESIKGPDDDAPVRMIHPGSGTSLLPLELTKQFPNSCHTVLDISPVALEEMRQIHDSHSSTEITSDNIEHGKVAYELENVLDPPLRFEDSSFDVWIDKGFVDAVFAKESQTMNKIQSRNLFHEANRILGRNFGLVIIVTLAEKHSLQLLLDDWCETDIRWNSSLHVWELQPVSGDLLPFCFVLSKSEAAAPSVKRNLIWHHIEGSDDIFSLEDMSQVSIVETVEKRLNRSREKFARRKETAQSSCRQVLATIDIKPFDPSSDLQLLASTIVSSTWFTPTISTQVSSRVLDPHWQPVNKDSSSIAEIIPIGFGISKIRLRCVIVSDDVEDLVEAISGWDGNDVFEGVQSVDIDWDETMPISNAESIFSKLV